MFIDNVNIKFDNKIIYENFSIDFEDNKINCIVELLVVERQHY